MMKKLILGLLIFIGFSSGINASAAAGAGAAASENRHTQRMKKLQFFAESIKPLYLATPSKEFKKRILKMIKTIEYYLKLLQRDMLPASLTMSDAEVEKKFGSESVLIEALKSVEAIIPNLLPLVNKVFTGDYWTLDEVHGDTIGDAHDALEDPRHLEAQVAACLFTDADKTSVENFTKIIKTFFPPATLTADSQLSCPLCMDEARLQTLLYLTCNDTKNPVQPLCLNCFLNLKASNNPFTNNPLHQTFFQWTWTTIE